MYSSLGMETVSCVMVLSLLTSRKRRTGRHAALAFGVELEGFTHLLEAGREHWTWVAMARAFARRVFGHVPFAEHLSQCQSSLSEFDEIQAPAPLLASIISRSELVFRQRYLRLCGWASSTQVLSSLRIRRVRAPSLRPPLNRRAIRKNTSSI